MKPDQISDEEQRAAELSWDFEASGECLDLKAQLADGLITSLEFCNKVQDCYARFLLYKES